MRLPYQHCPRCSARTYYVSDGLGRCARCHYRARTAPSALELAHARLDALLHEWPRGEDWEHRWLQAHATWRAALI